MTDPELRDAQRILDELTRFDPDGPTPTRYDHGLLQIARHLVSVLKTVNLRASQPATETGDDACKRLGIDVPTWAAEVRAKVAAAFPAPQPVEGVSDYTDADRERDMAWLEWSHDPPRPFVRAEAAAFEAGYDKGRAVASRSSTRREAAIRASLEAAWARENPPPVVEGVIDDSPRQVAK